ncbi:hypothetical protein [Paenibacillus luteus]|uniref:hypothetical protein n=1 Tax=Paenibacillus luteus TaxID=2545753 RepID=UPI0011443D3D|nr:hypothetical protein [Paenibacillus luteus]
MTNNKTPLPILIIGGAGVVGSAAARHLRAAHPSLPLTIGGRNLDKAQKLAEELGFASAVVVNLDVQDLGLKNEEYSGVIGALQDLKFAGQRFAQQRRIPFVTIYGSSATVAQDFSVFAAGPRESAVVHASHWSGGIPTILALQSASELARVDDIRILAVYDFKDAAGPMSQTEVTMDGGAPLYFRNGYFNLANDDSQKIVTAQAVDGAEITANITAMVDSLSLGTAFPNATSLFAVEFGDSSGTRSGSAVTHDIAILVSGEDRHGSSVIIRQDLVDPYGQLDQTGLGAALVMERVLGLDGGDAIQPGFYYPEHILQPEGVENRVLDRGIKLTRTTSSR